LKSSLLSPTQQQEIFEAFSGSLESTIRYPSADVMDSPTFSEASLNSLRLKLWHPPSPRRPIDHNKSHMALTRSQAEMCLILSEFAHVSPNRLKPETTIYQLGLDSISAIQLAAKLRALKGIKISAADILQRPVIADLAEILDGQSRSDMPSSSFNFDAFELKHKSAICEQFHLQRAQIQNVRPCTPLQVGLLGQFLHSKYLYVNHVSYEMDKSWTSTKLHSAWLTVAKAHIMLRTGFAAVDDTTTPFAMVTYTESACPELIEIVNPSTDVEKWRKDRTVQFHENLLQPPWAVSIMEIEDRLVMHITIFHGLYDAHSLDLVMNDLRLEGLPNVTEIDPLLSNLLRSAGGDAEYINSRTQFWKEMMGDTAVNKFPSLTPLVSSTGSTAVYSRNCSKLLEDLESCCSKEGITIQAAGQAAWARLLSTYIGESAVAFGVVLSGRDTIIDAEHVAFPCITTVPVPALVSGDNWKLLQSMMHFNSNVRSHQFTPMKDIQRCTGHHQPFFDTIFAFQKFSNSGKTRSWKVLDEIASAEVFFLPF
jgi:aryl carrier-like protein